MEFRTSGCIKFRTQKGGSSGAGSGSEFKAVPGHPRTYCYRGCTFQIKITGS